MNIKNVQQTFDELFSHIQYVILISFCVLNIIYLFVYIFSVYCFFAQDLQFVIKLSFRTFWILRNKEEMSIMEVIEYYHPECKDMTYLEEEDCKFLIIMDSFDCYQAHLDWEVSVNALVHLRANQMCSCKRHLEWTKQLSNYCPTQLKCTHTYNSG